MSSNISLEEKKNRSDHEKIHNIELEESDDEDETNDFIRTTINKAIKMFTFYETMYDDANSFDSLLNSLKFLKTHHSPKKTSKHVKISKSSQELKLKPKTFDIAQYQKTQESIKLTMSSTISRFRPITPKWDGSFTLNQEIENSLYRVPCRDPSGKVILNLSRDLAKGKIWKPPECDREIPVPTVNQCAATFQVRVIKHLDEVIEKITEEYAKLPTNTQAKSNLKAQAGADLNELIRRRDQLKQELLSQSYSIQNNTSHSKLTSPHKTKK